MSAPVLAGRGRRLAATVLDLLLVPVGTILLVLVTGVVEHAEDYVDNGWTVSIPLLAIASYLLLNGWLLLQRGQSMGKAALGIMIVDSRSQQAPLFGWLLLRALFFPLLYFGPLALIDLVWILGSQRRCLHDLVCRTRVIERRASGKGL
jgi:uncharacterized RDD family membrane protein YckC